MTETEKALADLAKRLKDLESKETDRRTAKLVAEAISRWERKRWALAVPVLCVLGITTFSEIKQEIADYFTNTVVEQIDAEVRTRTASISTEDPDIAELKVRTAELQEAVEQRGTTATTPIAPAALSGFAFYGIRKSDGGWSERHFKISGGGDRQPTKGDQITALSSVHVRSGYIVYGPGGWTNQRAIGVLRPGDNVRVDEAKEVVKGFWWISFVQ